VGAIAFSVGYESQSQFGREYRRLFGRSPGADAMAMRGELSRADGR
jgi:AraC-like DNA-binding protein